MIERQVGSVLRIAAMLVLPWALLIGQAGASDSLQPIGWDAGIRLPDAPDLNPDPAIVEIEMEARVATVEIAPGFKVEAWTYDGLIPGPLVRVNVGDRLIVHFSNSLPSSTTIHWHGLRVPIEMDGVPGYAQPPVEPGGTFTYDFIVPDAGIYWYHPHVMSAAQVGFGLYGAFLVADPDEDVGVPDDLVVLLSDIDLTEGGLLESPDTGGSLGMAFGREGNHVLVNGKKTPSLMARAGAPQRWRVINAAKSRYFKLDLGDAQRFRKVGGDGGLLEYSVDQDFVVLGAGERADVLATPGETQLWTVENTTAWSHPIHLHGFFFMVLDDNGEPVRPFEWKDTVDVPFKQTVRLVVRFDDDRPGTWIFHCHILDHADGGLLNAVQLGLPVRDFKPLASH